jgi:transcriptional regulator with XRE-family HTH domain
MSRIKQQFGELLRLDTEVGRLVYKRQFLRMNVAHSLQRMRTEANLTQTQLAELARMSQPAVSRLERAGGWRAPELSTIVRFAEICGFEAKLIFRRKPKGKRQTTLTTELSPERR